MSKGKKKMDDKLSSEAVRAFEVSGVVEIAEFMRYARAGRPECFLAVRKWQCAMFEMELAVKECRLNDYMEGV